ncbi:MAG: aminodeoxychorismate lyase [Rhodospirillaceae bacterium]|nr:MAG: aminodeoxychorismate lyase [Rhodospirillaceae bacterium]
MTPPVAGILVNGQAAATLPVDDRGFRYGDGIFETICVRAGAPEFWSHHLRRLRRGTERLNLAWPEENLLAAEARQLLAQSVDGVLRIWLTRGPGGEGYRPATAMPPTRLLRFDPSPAVPAPAIVSPDFAAQGVSLRVCQTRLGQNPALAGIKHLNRLEQVLATAEWDAPDIEGLMLDTAGNVIEGTKTNIFFLREGNLITPDLTQAGVAGVVREIVLEEAAHAERPVTVRPIRLAEALGADECFLTNSLIHLWPVRDLDGKTFAIGPVSLEFSRRIAARALKSRSF